MSNLCQSIGSNLCEDFLEEENVKRMYGLIEGHNFSTIIMHKITRKTQQTMLSLLGLHEYIGRQNVTKGIVWKCDVT